MIQLRKPEDLQALEALILFEPFLEIVRSEHTSGLVTEAALTGVTQLLTSDCGILSSRDGEEVLELVAEAATHCRFEGSSGIGMAVAGLGSGSGGMGGSSGGLGSNDDGDEVVLSSILQLLRACLSHELGARLEDETVFGMVQTCVRLALQPRFSPLLRRMAENTALEMMTLVFARVIPTQPPLPVENETRRRHEVGVSRNAGEEETSASTTASPPPTDEEILESILFHVTNSERPEVEKDIAGVVNTQRVQFSKESNTVKKMLESGFSVCCKLFKLICSLLDRTRSSNSEASVLLGFNIIQAVLLKFGSTLERVPGLIPIVQDDLSLYLIQNLQTDNFLILSGALSLTRNLFVFLTRHIKLQMELILNKLIEWIMVEGVPYQKQEVTLEFLVDLLRVPNFISELYINYDCDPNCSDLFERIAVFLYKNSYPPDGSLYTTHVLTLDGLLSIARGIADHIEVTAQGEGEIDPQLVRRRKTIKKNLLQGAKEFNEKKKEERFVFLQQCGLLPNPLTPHAVARFFRTTPNLDKSLVGEFLGSTKEFELQVLEAYLKTFKMSSDFLGVLRTFLESFKIPGEAQIIQRVLERFSHHFFEAHKDEGVFASEDAVFLLAYATLILHVDNHSEKIVNKMLESQFKKTLRGTNGSKDFPDEMLSQIYFSVSTTEIKIFEDYFEGPVTPLRWKGLQKRAKRFANFYSVHHGGCDKDIFTLMWGRLIAAIGVVFSNSYNNEILAKATEGFKLCAKISAHFAMSDVFDNLIVTLCKHSALLSSRVHSQRVNPVMQFGTNEKSQIATSLVFSFTREYGNHLREGWRNVVDAILNLNSVRLLQVPQLFALPEFLEPPEVAAASQEKVVRGSSGIFSLFGGSWFGGSSSESSSPLVSHDRRSPSPPPSSAPESDAVRAARECISKCRVDEIIAGSAKLQHDALVYLVKALILGSVRSHAVDHASDTPGPGDESFNENASQLCLDMLTQITLLNEHRIVMIWVLVYEHMSDIIASEVSTKPLVQRTIGNLLLLCVSFFRHREISEQLVKCLHNILKLSERRKSAVVCFKMGAAVLRMLTLNPQAFLSASGWSTLVAALRFALNNPEAGLNVVASLKLILHYGGLDRDNMVELDKTLALAGVVVVEDAKAFTFAPSFAHWKDLMSLLDVLCKQSPGDGGDVVSGSVIVDVVSVLDVLYLSSPKLMDESRVDDQTEKAWRYWKNGWQPVLSLLCDLCCHRQSIVRHASITAVQCLLLSNQMNSVPPALWRVCFKTILFPMLEHLASLQGRKATSVDPLQLEQTRLRAFAVLHKVFLIYLPQLSAQLDDDFTELWLQVLDVNERYLHISSRSTSSGSSLPSASNNNSNNSTSDDALSEAVPESLKNVLLVLYDARVLDDTKPLAKVTWERIARFRLAVDLRAEVQRLIRGEQQQQQQHDQGTPKTPVKQTTPPTLASPGATIDV